MDAEAKTVTVSLPNTVEGMKKYLTEKGFELRMVEEIENEMELKVKSKLWLLLLLLLSNRLSLLHV